MNVLFILNDAPYGTEKSYNGLRLAMALQKQDPAYVIRIFLMADAVNCAVQGQKTPDGYYNIERMLKAVIHKGGEVQLCGTCCEARGIASPALIEGCQTGTMTLLAQWTTESDKTLTF